MPKVLGYTPPWLSSGNPGAAIFSPETSSPASPSRRPSPRKDSAQAEQDGSTRLIAYRGTEVFVAVGKEIRWADLSAVQSDWENHPKTRNNDANRTQQQAYRILSVSVHDQDIRQLIISPSGYFLAICAEHTIRIAILPDSSRLSQDKAPLKLKTFQLGPTTHVKPESAIAAVLWHPLAASTPTSDCLITVTSGAAVRLWEIDRSRSWSFDRPALAIDLRRLADGVSCDQDFKPADFGKNRGFSVDDIDMEAVAASFGGSAQEDEDAWASMTVWTAMKNGDVYALCPLLPSKWSPTNTTIPSLSTSAVSRIATIAAGDADIDERQAAEQQYEWVQEIDDVEPIDNSDLEVRLRPQNPSAIPRLQGPFSLDLDDEAADVEVTDLVIFPAHVDESDLYSGEDDFYDAQPSGFPFTTLLLATSANKVHVTLNVVSVSGQWLPRKGRSTFSVPTYEGQELTLVDVVSFPVENTASPFLVFSRDPVHPYSVFATDGTTVRSISLDDWAFRITHEVGGDEEVDAGLKIRLETSCKSQITVDDEIFSNKTEGDLTAPVILDDPNLGYFLLSATKFIPFAASLDQPHLRTSTQPLSPVDFSRSQNLGTQLIRFEMDEPEAEAIPTRPIYAPPTVLFQHPEHPLNQLLRQLPMKQKTILKEQPMRLSPSMLDVMTSAHRTISRQSTELESAAAELFRRCDRLRQELNDQIKQMSELADRLQRVRSGERDDYDIQKQRKKTPDERLQTAMERQVAMTKRYEALRKKVGRAGMTNKQLSAKEVAWVGETDALAKAIGLDGSDKDTPPAAISLVERYEDVKQIAQKLLEESRRLEARQEDLAKSTASLASGPSLQRSDSAASKSSGVGGAGHGMVSARYQREKIAEVMASVEREGAIIDAVMGRLERLQV